MDNRRVWENAQELREYAKANQFQESYLLRCPVCGHARLVKRGYVVGNGFKSKHRMCNACAVQASKEIMAKDRVEVKCKRCHQTRKISRDLWLKHKQSKYCQSCASAIAQGKVIKLTKWAKHVKKHMPKRCAPIKMQKPETSNRQIWCRHYDTCLDFCIANNWPSFGCQECHGYEMQSIEQRLLPLEAVMEIYPSNL